MSIQGNSTSQKVYPKRLAISQMLKLGRKMDVSTTIVELFSFNLTNMLWSKLDNMPVEFVIAKKPFASGGFRAAHKASSQTRGFEKDGCVYIEMPVNWPEKKGKIKIFMRNENE